MDLFSNVKIEARKDLFIQLIDFENIENNLFKIVNQLEIQGYEKRIPDAIVYVNGLPLSGNRV